MAIMVFLVLAVLVLLGLAVGVVVLVVYLLRKESRAITTVPPAGPANQPETQPATPEER